MGELPFHAIELGPSENGDKVLRELQEIARRSADGMLVLVDVFGGTPFNASAQLMQLPSIECVAGVNLPMILEVVMALQSDKATSPKELAKIALRAGQRGIKNARQILRKLEHRSEGR